MATWDGGCSGCSRRMPGATIAITALRGMFGRGDSRPFRFRMTTILFRCSAMSIAMRCEPSWCRGPRTGSGRAYPVGGRGDPLLWKGEEPVRDEQWLDASTSRCRRATFNGCVTRCRVADRMGKTLGLARRRSGWDWSRACVPRDDRVGRTCKRAMFTGFSSPLVSPSVVFFPVCPGQLALYPPFPLCPRVTGHSPRFPYVRG